MCFLESKWLATKLELDVGTTAAAALLEHEWMTTTEGVALSLEGVWSLLRVGIIATVETGTQLGVAQNFICLVDAGHLLLGLFLRDTLFGGLIRVEDL